MQTGQFAIILVRLTCLGLPQEALDAVFEIPEILLRQLDCLALGTLGRGIGGLLHRIDALGELAEFALHQFQQIILGGLLMAGNAVGKIGDPVFQTRDHRRIDEQAVAVDGCGCRIGDIVQPLLHGLQAFARLALAHLDVIDNVAQRGFERVIARHVLGILREAGAAVGEFVAERLKAFAETGEILGRLAFTGFDAGENVGERLILGPTALVIAADGRILVLTRHSGQLLGEMIQLRLDVDDGIARHRLRRFDIIGLFADDGVQPLAERHARAACRILRGLARLGVDTLHAPRNTRLHARSNPRDSTPMADCDFQFILKVNFLGKISVKVAATSSPF